MLPNIDDLMWAGMSSGPVKFQHINNVTDTKVTIRNVTAQNNSCFLAFKVFISFIMMPNKLRFLDGYVCSFANLKTHKSCYTHNKSKRDEWKDYP